MTGCLQIGYCGPPPSNSQATVFTDVTGNASLKFFQRWDPSNQYYFSASTGNNAEGFGGPIYVTDFGLSLAASTVLEPAALSLLGIGLVGLGVSRKRKNENTGRVSPVTPQRPATQTPHIATKHHGAFGRRLLLCNLYFLSAKTITSSLQYNQQGRWAPLLANQYF